MNRTESDIKSQRKYEKTLNKITVRYTKEELSEYLRFSDYIDNMGYSKNMYIKSLIKQDMDKKHIPYSD